MTMNFKLLIISWKNKITIYSIGVISFVFSINNLAYASEPKPWQMDLQEPAGIIASKATDLHNFLLVIITLISVFVLGLLIYVCIKFREKPNVFFQKLLIIL